jgi:hypothetical protein
MTRIYEKATVDEIAVLYGDDKPANPRATSLMSKSVAAPPLSPWAAREAELQKLADIETAKVSRASDIKHAETVKRFGEASSSNPDGGSSRSGWHEYRKSLFDGSRPPMGKVAATPVVDLAYERVMAKAQAAADRHEYPTTEQAFAALWNVELLEKRRAKGTVKPPAAESQTDDGDQDNDDGAGSGQPDNAEEASGMALSGHKGEPAASTQPGGKSRGNYDRNGGPTMVSQQSSGQPGGPPTKSNQARPASATKKSKKSKLQKRAERYVHVFPDVAQALKVAALPKSLSV